MHKTCKQIFSGYSQKPLLKYSHTPNIHTYRIEWLYSHFLWYYVVLLFAFLTFLTYTFCFHYCCILVLSKYLGNINWEVLQLAKFGNPCLPWNFWSYCIITDSIHHHHSSDPLPIFFKRGVNFNYLPQRWENLKN